MSVELKVFAQSMFPDKFLVLVHLKMSSSTPSSSFQLDSYQIASVFWLESQLQEYLFVFIY